MNNQPSTPSSRVLRQRLQELTAAVVPPRVDFEAFRDCREGVVAQSAAVELLEDFLERLREVNDRATITVLSGIPEDQGIAERLERFRVEIAGPEKGQSGRLEATAFQKVIERLKGRKIDFRVALFGNLWGQGYENVITLLEAIPQGPLLAWSVSQELYRLDPQSLRQQAQARRALQALAESVFP